MRPLPNRQEHHYKLNDGRKLTIARMLDRLLRPAAKIVDQAYVAARLARQTDVAAVQDQPVMGVQHEFGRDHFLQPEFDLERRLARCEAGAVADAEHMGIDRHGGFAERHVEHDIGGLAAGAGQRLELGARARHLAAELGDQLFRQRDDVLGLVAVEPDGLDVARAPCPRRARPFFAAYRRPRTTCASPC